MSSEYFRCKMAASLSQEEEKVVQHFLDEVNRQRVFKQQGQVTWNDGVKFLMARKFDLKRAIDLFISHEGVREREDLVNIDPSDKYLQREISTEKFTILNGRDNSGAALALFTARNHQPPKTTHQIVLKGLIYQLDAALHSLETQRHGLVFVYDMTDSKYANFDYELSIKILNLLKGGYPARLKKVLIVTAPLWFKAPFKILRLFVREKLRDRVYTVSLSQLSQYIPRDSIPEHLGGSVPTSHKAWLQLCYKIAISETVDMDSYFISRKRSYSSTGDGESRSSVTRSLSSDMDLHFSDMDSETSKETVNEKHNHEDREKEREDVRDGNKDVFIEKESDSILMSGKKRRTSDGRSNADSRKRISDSSTVDNSPNDQQVSDLPIKRRPPSSGSNILDDSIHMPDQGGMNLKQLVEHVKSLRRKGLFSEYARIKMEAPTGTFNASKARVNLPKNRYTDVLCFDHSRVVLPVMDADPTSDYINANFVDGYMQKNSYISTQGPLPKTFVDFWSMVWNYQCQVIVMTTRTIERQRMKCGQYWPNEEQTDEQFEEFIVYNNGISTRKDYTETKLLLHNTKTGESREITHLQFTSWPDFGVPPATTFLDFLFHARQCQEEATKFMGGGWQGHPRGPPMVVHCSAGIGRTGTFITIDICLRRLEDIGTVDVQESVRRIRSQRCYSIQMPDQYVFCHLAIIEHAVRNGLIKEVDLALLDDSDESD
ncbi:tyrosine-protein phosphatase non-receptor type 9-like isoform X2 [Haliotis rufescens]|uniref:tyrosine-protein phosphatase non-receptor type 9-like isoform X2 n=1 Tax=Haliotis rufescens TaxID=6454 RepID=UPI001EB08078|nr:tyrosine-protein phosphatase non-receptor type 9-like isoform X2 [Haliotis rufescens]